MHQPKCLLLTNYELNGTKCIKVLRRALFSYGHLFVNNFPWTSHGRVCVRIGMTVSASPGNLTPRQSESVRSFYIHSTLNSKFGYWLYEKWKDIFKERLK